MVSGGDPLHCRHLGRGAEQALEAGVYLVKPNLRELESVVGRSLRAPAEQEAAQWS